MFQVPIIQDSAQLQTDTGRRRNQADANAYGAAEARALGAVSEGLSNVAEVAAEKQDELAETRARELDNELSRRLRDRLYNTETGYFSTARGRNALDRRAQVESDIDAIVNELAASAPDERSRRLFADVGRRRATDALGDVAVYAARQADEYRNTVSEAAIEESISNAIAVYDDPVQRAAHMDTGVAEIQRLAERMGWDEQVRDNRIRQYQSDLNARVIVQLAQNDPERAETMFQTIAPSLTAEERAQLSATMRGVRRQAEENITDEAWTYVSEGRAIPPELWARVPGRARIDIQDYRRRRAEGGDGSGDRRLYTDIMDEALSDPEAFGRRDLRAERGALGDRLYLDLRERQERVRNGEGLSGALDDRFINRAMARAHTQWRIAGLPLTASGEPSADADADDVARYAELRTDFMGLLERFTRDQGREPTEAEINDLARRLTVERRRASNGILGFGRREAVRLSDQYVPYSQIPPQDRARVAALLQEEGLPATPSNIESEYERLRADALGVPVE